MDQMDSRLRSPAEGQPGGSWAVAEAPWGASPQTGPVNRNGTLPTRGQLASWEGEGSGECGGVPGFVNGATDDSRDRRLQL